MTKTLTISQGDFKRGLHIGVDDSDAPFGSARKMFNCIITDRGGISPRPGVKLLGEHSNANERMGGLFNFKKSLGASEILIRARGTRVEFYHEVSGEWVLLKDGFESGEEFGFTTSLVNTDSEDYTYFCNRFQEYQRWNGSIATITSALSGSETSIPVTSTLRPAIYEAKTATSNSTTTLEVAGTPWASSQWVNFYVLIKAGAQEGQVRKITANTNNTITFDALAGAPGNVDFEIRQLAFPATGTLIYNGQTIAYSAIPSEDAFTVSSAHATHINTPVTLAPEVFPVAPRGNRIEAWLGRTFVGNVRSALSRDSSGDLQGSAQAGSVFVSKINDPKDFSFAATRVAGEGDILATPYGGGEITDIKAQEGVVYVYKRRYIESVRYSQDDNDIALREPLKSGVGSVGRVIKGTDDHYFITEDKQYTSIRRVESKDILPQTENLGISIRRFLETMNHESFNGIEFKNRIFSCHGSTVDTENNDVILIYNKENKSFEGVWNLPASRFEVWKSNLYFGESNGINVWQMFEGVNDALGATEIPIEMQWKSSFFNVLPRVKEIQAVNSVEIEGYIRTGSSFTFEMYSDFNESPILSFDFTTDEEEFLTGGVQNGFLGDSPLGLTPLGGVEVEEDSEGMRRFNFIVYFPWQYGKYLSTGVFSNKLNNKVEIIRTSLGLKESISTRRKDTKQI